MRTLDASALSYAAAADALEAALLDGLDVDADPPRSALPVGAGELLVMPSSLGVVKLVSVGGEPRIQGVAVVFDRDTLAPVGLIDGVALTTLRTAAVSLLAVRRLGGSGPVLIFGRGPQARAHAAALRGGTLVGRGEPADVEGAGIICCCTTSRTPLFDGARVRDDAVVVAVGSHEPDARETDDTLAHRATVVVESRTAALREAGDVIAPGLRGEDLVELADLVRGRADSGRGPWLFKSVGMAWEDAVVANAIAAI